MSTIDPSIVKRMAELGRLELASDELTQAAQKLEQVLSYFAAIQNISTKDVSPADNVTGVTNVWRADEAKPNMLCAAEDLVAAAPVSEGEYIKVHAVL